MNELDSTKVESIVRRIITETLDKKNEELLSKIRIFVEMSLNKVVDAKMKVLEEKLHALPSSGDNSELSPNALEMNSALSEIMREINSLTDICNELLDKVDGLEVRLEEP